MPLSLDEIERVIEGSCGKLLGIAIPPVRYFLHTDLGAKREDDPLVIKTLEECAVYKPRQRLLATLRQDGTWPIPRERRLAEEAGPGPPIGWTYITLLRNLFMLHEYRATRSEGHISASLERILSWQAEDGHIPGPWTEIFPLPHYNGSALRVLISFGLEKDPRVQRLIRWLLKMQRPDGGWSSPYLDDVHYLPEYKNLRIAEFTDKVRRGEIEYGDPSRYAHIRSCTWGTLLVLRGLLQSYELARRPEVRRGASLVLDRFFTKNPIATFQGQESYWTNLKYPTYMGSGLLALDLLTWMGFGSDDKRLEKPIAWLLSARGKDGLWSQTERPHPEKDQWISEIALSILNRYAQSMRGERFGIDAEAVPNRRSRE